MLEKQTLVCQTRAKASYTTLTDTSPGDNYDISLTITRTAGKSSAAIYLPTSIGTLNFDLDGCHRQISGIQNLGGKDMRQHSITAYVDGSKRYTWNLRGRNGSITPLWNAPVKNRISVGAWDSIISFSNIQLKKITSP
ncbi:MAG: hypothetical protein ACSHXG_15600 [Maribacter stanieri]